MDHRESCCDLCYRMFCLSFPPSVLQFLPVIFDWMSVIVSFSLLGAGYFRVPVNSLEFYSVMKLSYSENFCEH